LSSFRFLHCADLHLDSPMAGLVRRGEVRADLFEGATRRAFERLVTLAIDQDVAFVVIAGDVYDGDWRDHGTGLFFNEQMRRLAPRPVFVARGNHDAASIITRSLTVPDNVRVFGTRRPETHVLEALGVAVHGQSFADRAVTGNMAAAYPPPVAGLFNIGVLHTSAEGEGRHVTYAPCTLGGLVAHGYDYWALGHVHERAELSRDPWIVFPGNVQGRGVHEPGEKGGTLVEVTDGRVVALVHHATDVLRWDVVSAPVGGVSSWETLRASVTAALGAVNAEGRPVVVRLRLEGRTAMHGALRAEPDRVLAECRDVAGALSAEIAIERVVDDTAPERAASAAEDEQMSMLDTLFRAAADDEATIAALLAEIRALRSALPADAAAALPDDAGGVREMARAAWPAVEVMLRDRA
jgi:DNA repair exonuclease SbcCD nuclease subunit